MGFSLNPQNIQMLADAINNLISNKNLRTQLGIAARKTSLKILMCVK